MVGSIYRPPGAPSTVTQVLYAYLSVNLKAGDKLVLAGDFNLPDINWAYFSIPSYEKNAIEILDLAFNQNLVQVVQEASRVQGNCRNILDLVFLSNNLSSFNYGIELIQGISGHDTVVLTLNTCDVVQKEQVTRALDFNSADDCSIIDELAYRFINFELAVDQGNQGTEHLPQMFKSVVSYCIAQYVPLKFKNVTPETLG